MDLPVESLVADLGRAWGAAEGLAGRAPVGVRAVEPAVGRRSYLAAFDEGVFLCLGGDLAAERDAAQVREVAACVLLVEHAESLVDVAELELVASLAARLVGLLDDRPILDALAAVGQASIDLAAWRTAPERALASLPELEHGIRRHDRVREGFARFVEATEPLVMRQDELPDEVVAALRDLEQAAGRAGLDRPLAAAAAEAMAAIDAGAQEMVAGHLTRMS